MLATLQGRVTTAISAILLPAVLGGAILFAMQDGNRVEQDTHELAQRELTSLLDQLSLTDQQMQERVKASMKLLKNRGEGIGAASAGQPVGVKDKQVPELLLGDKAQANQFELVDGVVDIMGGTATLFSKSGDDFVRVSTTVKKDGARAIGTVLDPKGRAIAAIKQGTPFYGQVDILGNPYLTGYEPIYDASKATVGIWYVGYKVDLKPLQETVGRAVLLQSGFVAVVDDKGKVRFHSNSVDDARAQQVVDQSPADWVRVEQPFDAWKFKVVATYPSSEVSQIVRKHALGIIAGGLVVAVVLLVVLLMLLRRLVLRPIGGEPGIAAQAAKAIADGDLAFKLDIGQAQPDSVLAGMARMQSSLRAMVQEIQREAAEVNDIAERFKATSRQIADGSARQSDATTTMAAALEELSTSISHISANAQTALHSTEQSAALSRQGEQVIERTVTEIRGIADQVDDTASVIEALSVQTTEIVGVVKVIKEVADQTNLLALNAAIEAARAGEQGRGFAVVADEVRKLAERTAASTQEITRTIDAIQHSARNTTQTVQATRDKVGHGVQLANEAGEAIQQIETASGEVLRVNAEITTALREQSQVSNEIAVNVEQVTQMISQNQHASHEAAAEAEEMHQVAMNLNATLQRFRL